jgi:hypothetical protein
VNQKSKIKKSGNCVLSLLLHTLLNEAEAHGGHMKCTIAALVPLLMAGAMTSASAQAGTEQINVIGFYNTSCGTWTQARANQQSPYMEYWAIGFVSGAHFMRHIEGATGILDGGDAQAIYIWIDNYCRSKPLDAFPQALFVLVTELKKRAHQ